jgi:hypothetical protein
MNRRQLLMGVAGSSICNFSLWAQALQQQASGQPDPLVFFDGRAVTPSLWSQRRKEILENARSQMYGISPSASDVKFEVLERDGVFFNGAGTRKQVRLHLGKGNRSRTADLLLYLPRHRKQVPMILGLNFWGNHSVCSDPSIILTSSNIEQGKNPFIDLSCVREHAATAACRGIDSRRWPIETILKRGYGVATLCRTDIDPDLPDGWDGSLRAIYPELQSRPDNFSAIGAWAWTLSRAMDYLETDRDVDARRVAVYGWSRLGKAALWAGANDERFAAVLSQESGAGGVKLFRRGMGEDIRRLNTIFPHWFCKAFHQYDGLDEKLPFDQHLIVASLAPRPIHIASAQDDHLSDPPGEFASAMLATPAYRMLGYSGLAVQTIPALNSPVFGRISYHIRPGIHDVTDYDWEQYLHFLDLYFKSSD